VATAPDVLRLLRRLGVRKRDAVRLLAALSPTDRDVLTTLAPEELRVFVASLVEQQTQQQSALLEDLWATDYREKPVPIRQFLEDRRYLGNSTHDAEGRRTLYPLWWDELDRIFAADSEVWEVVLTGSIGSGKCGLWNMLVPTNQGLKTLAAVHADPTVTHVQTRRGLRRIVQRHDEGETATVTVRTKHGHGVQVRPNHRLRVLDGLRAAWCRADELRPGMTLLEAPARVWGQRPLALPLAELLGWAVAEGAFPSASKAVALSVHPDEVPHLIRLLRAVGLPWRRHAERRGAVRLDVWGLRAYIDSDGSPHGRVNGINSHSVVVPPVVLESSRAAVCAFLRGLFSGDAAVAANGAVEWCTMSRELARQVRVLLTALGIECSVHLSRAGYVARRAPQRPLAGSIVVERAPGRVRVRTGTRYRLGIVGYDAKLRFLRRIGFVQAAKAAGLRAALRSRNADHSFSFRLDREAALVLRNRQPIWDGGAPGKSRLPLGLTRATTPRRLLDRVIRGQRVTVSLLRQIAVHGSLPPVLRRIAQRKWLFDEVASVAPSRGHCYDLTVEGDPSYVADGFIHHNTTTATIILLYCLYRLSCLRDPQTFYRMVPGSLIAFGLYNVLKYKVETTSFHMMDSMVRASPYFSKVFARDENHKTTLRFPRSVRVVSGSQEVHALGENLFAVLIDEVDFMRAGLTPQERGQAFELHVATRRRMESRFLRSGRLPGVSVLVSSKQTTDSYVSQYIAQHRDDPHVYVVDRPLWEVKVGYYSRKTFPVLVGDGRIASRVLADDEPIPAGARVVRPPIDFRESFLAATDQALMDIAGVAVTGIHRFLSDRQSVFDLVADDLAPPFVREEVVVDVRTAATIEDFLDHARFVQPHESRYRPKVRPGVPRYVAGDLALSGDCAGLAMAHVAGSKQVVRQNEDGARYIETAPIIEFDFALRLRPPSGSQIDLSKIRQFLMMLVAYGFPLRKITFDGYNSADTIQALRKQGLDAEVYSMDRVVNRQSEGYVFLRQALFDRRVRCYRYVPLLDELVNLEEDPKTHKVDHPRTMTSLTGASVRGSKDVADAVGAVVRAIMVDPAASGGQSVTPAPRPVRETSDLLDPSWVVGQRVIGVIS
jgi:hypothetical protein